jgi:hypothetical protein
VSRRAWAFGLLMLALSPRGIAEAADPRITFDQVMSKWTVASDGTWVVDAEVTVRAPENNLTHVVQIPLTWSASTERLEIVQARLDKPDGRSVIVGKESIREDPPTGDQYFHEYSDEHRMLITFTDAQTDDLLVVRARRDVFRPRVPGGFMAAPGLDRGVGWEEANYTISVPADMPFHVETHGFDEQSEVIRDRVMHYLHAPKAVVRPRDVAVLGAYDRLPHFAASTFRDWDEFGRAYASVLVPHAKVTPAINALAAKITEGMQDPWDQARALHAWVRDHILYIPIPLEKSQREPHDAEQVLTNRYGDNKDHVVVLYALLAAKQIAAEMVLLNASNSATISDPPNIRPMDHLIIFVPSLNAYADSTIDSAPFAVLPFSQLGKPAIHLGGTGPARRDIPIPASGLTLMNMKTDVTLAEDGDVSGTTTTTARGAFGIWLRNAARSFGENDPGAAVTLLREHGTPGTGTFSFDAPNSPTVDYTVRGTFRLQNQSALLHGGFFALWTGLRILPRPGDVLAGPMFMRDLPKTEPSFCFPGVQSEQLSLTIPEGRELGSLPSDIRIDSELVRYRSHWTLDGRRVTVTREFESLVPGPVCDGPRREEMAAVLAKIRADLVNPIGIRQDHMPASVTTSPDDTLAN